MSGGFRPIQDRSGHPYCGKVETYAVKSTHASLLAVGDLVIETGNLDTATGISEVDAAAAAGLITGVIVGIDYNMSNLEQKGLPAGIAGTVKVANDKDMLLEAETSGGTFAVTDVGGNLDIVATAATASGGLVNSNMTINATGAASSATAQVRIVSVKNSGSLTYPAAIGTTLVCRINESTNDTVGV